MTVSTFEDFLDEPSEINAAAIGVRHAFSRKIPILVSDIGNLNISAELREDLTKKYNYYLGAFWAARGVLAGLAIVAVHYGYAEYVQWLI